MKSVRTIICKISGHFELQCRMANKPYDIFGTWYNDRYLLSGDLYWLAHLVSTSILWLNKASQESSSEHVAIMDQLFRFYNRNASSIRAIMVADCLASEEEAGETGVRAPVIAPEVEQQSGNPPSHHAQTSKFLHHGQDAPRDRYLDIINLSVFFFVTWIFYTSRNLAQCDSTCDFPSPIQYKKEYRLAEAEFLPDDGNYSHSSDNFNKINLKNSSS